MRRKLGKGVGALLLLAFMLILFGIIFHIAGLNLLEPILSNVAGFFIIANTCLLLALVVDRFDKPSKSNK